MAPANPFRLKTETIFLPQNEMIVMPFTDDVKNLIGETLQIQDRMDAFTAQTPLLGHVPELDSMAVVSIMNALEEKFNFTIEDDEITIDTFESIATLTAFVNEKMAAR